MLLKRKLFSIITMIIGITFLFFLILYTNKTKPISNIPFTPKVFYKPYYSNSSTNSTNNSIAIDTKNAEKIAYNISKSDDFKLTCSKSYSYSKNPVYALELNYNHISLPILSFYGKPNYKYGLFDDKKSFWVIVNSAEGQKKYDAFVFYSLQQPKPIKIYESDINESVKNIDIEYKNDVIKIISPSGIFNLSKFGQVTKS